MISFEQIQDILSLYKKHGWKLRKVLLTQNLRKRLGDFEFPVETFESEVDAAWFSRSSGQDRESWELRRLSETPYALFETFETEDEEEVRAEIRREMEAKIQQNFPHQL